jgi:hypothetical protein
LLPFISSLSHFSKWVAYYDDSQMCIDFCIDLNRYCFF